MPLVTADIAGAMQRIRGAYPQAEAEGLKRELTRTIASYRARLEPRDLTQAIDGFIRGGTFPDVSRLNDHLKAKRSARGKLREDAETWVVWCGCNTGLMFDLPPRHTYCPTHNVSQPIAKYSRWESAA